MRVTSAPPIMIAPDVGSSSPAIMRSVVVLPQPEGPSKVTRVPAAIVNEMSLTAATSPYSLLTFRNSIDAAFMAWMIVLIVCSIGRSSGAQLSHNGWCDACATSKSSCAYDALDQPDDCEHQDDQH